MSLFLDQPRDRVLRQRHFTATVEGFAGPGLYIFHLYCKDSFLHDLTGIAFSFGEKVLRCFYKCHPVDLAGKPVGKDQDERRILHSAITEEYLSSPRENTEDYHHYGQ